MRDIEAVSPCAVACVFIEHPGSVRYVGRYGG